MKREVDTERLRSIIRSQMHEQEMSISRGGKLLPLAVEYLRDNHMIDEDFIESKPEDCNFTREDFRDICRYLEAEAEGKTVEKESYFPEVLCFFNYKGFRFTMRLLIGQGSTIQLYADYDAYREDYRKELEVKV